MLHGNILNKCEVFGIHLCLFFVSLSLWSLTEMFLTSARWSKAFSESTSGLLL